MWGDEKFCALSPIQPSAQALWIFLLTGPHTGPIPGLFRSGRAAMAEELNWDLEAFEEAFREVFQQGMAQADWKAKVVWIPNAIKCNRPESPNVVRSWASEWALIPECDLKREAYKSLRTNIHGLGEAYGKAFDEAFGKPCGKASEKPSGKTCGNQEQEQEQDIKHMSGKPDAAAVIEYLNQKAGRSFKPVPANTKLIAARMREGATVDQLKAVVDAKVGDWLHDPKMCEYLRPATLFNAEKFGQYAGALGSSNAPVNGASVLGEYGDMLRGAI